MKTAILGIDIQNDFTLPTGALSVTGADADVGRISDFILSNQQNIDYIALTLDSHQPIHIAHQCYWKGQDGNSPALFSTITVADVRDGVWMPQYNKERAIAYLEQLERKGEVCTIWPTHCLLGTEGWALNGILTDCLAKWAINNGRSYELFYKGYSQSTEHYSIFRAAVEWEGEPETSLNTRLLSILNDFDEVLLIGEAADYCVANSLNDILDECDRLAKKLVVLTDCMSWINPDNEKAKAIFEKAKDRGVRFVASTEYRF
jgi:nicotinamidase-related amidase